MTGNNLEPKARRVLDSIHFPKSMVISALAKCASPMAAFAGHDDY